MPASGGKVLIVESHANLTLALEFLFLQHGFETRVCASGEEALEALEKECPDCIVMETLLPLRSGFEVCQILRRRPAWRKAKVVILSSTGREVDRAKAMAVGADACIFAPFSTAELMHTVRALLEVQS